MKHPPWEALSRAHCKCSPSQRIFWRCLGELSPPFSRRVLREVSRAARVAGVGEEEEEEPPSLVLVLVVVVVVVVVARDAATPPPSTFTLPTPLVAATTPVKAWKGRRWG